MNIPDKVKIGGHIIEITYCSTKTLSNEGEYNHYHHLIRLRKEEDTPKDAIEEAFLHEILEAIKAFNNLELSHIDLTVISESLYQIFKDNNIFGGSDELIST